jgi:RNA polymerase sigma factor (sigma-70 family)
MGVIRGLAVGDEIAPAEASRQVIEQLHAQMGQPLWGFARRQGLSDAEAEDVVQETMLRLYRTLTSGSVVDRPDAWAYRTAYRLAMDRHRLRRRWLAVRERLVHAGSEGVPTRDEALAVWSEIDRLPARQRQVLYLRYQADLAFEAIGEVLGIDSATARSNATRGLATLRQRLAVEETD